MEDMKSMLRHVEGHGVQYDVLAFVCPGCRLMERGSTGLHMLPINTTIEHKPTWTWNSNLEKPTLTPSILTGKGTENICHNYLKDGVFQYLGDCTHVLANLYVPMMDLPAWFIEEAKDESTT